MTHREPDPVEDTRRCPRCAKADHVTPTTDHERDRTACGWWCSACNLAFEGTASEFMRIQAKVLADAAEAMATRPQT